MAIERGEVMWVITGNYGVYCASNWLTRKDAIRDHCEAIGRPWAELRKNGDHAIKVRLVPVGEG